MTGDPRERLQELLLDEARAAELQQLLADHPELLDEVRRHRRTRDLLDVALSLERQVLADLQREPGTEDDAVRRALDGLGEAPTARGRPLWLPASVLAALVALAVWLVLRVPQPGIGPERTYLDAGELRVLHPAAGEPLDRVAWQAPEGEVGGYRVELRAADGTLLATDTVPANADSWVPPEDLRARLPAGAVLEVRAVDAFGETVASSGPIPVRRS